MFTVAVVMPLRTKAEAIVPLFKLGGRYTGAFCARGAGNVGGAGMGRVATTITAITSIPATTNNILSNELLFAVFMF
jgi:hypothetical protein